MTKSTSDCNSDIQKTCSVRRRPQGWNFGSGLMDSDEEKQWWKRHEPTVDKWLTELEEAGDPWNQSAEHAAYCLVSSRWMEWTWEGFSVQSFLYQDLLEGGTVGFFGSSEKFYDQTVEALQRFVNDGIIEKPVGEKWIAELVASREGFLRHIGAFETQSD